MSDQRLQHDRDQPGLVSIGLPVYNGGRQIERAIRSLLAQTYGQSELVVSDNASTDDTVRIVRELAGRDGRIRLVTSAENRGAAWNFTRVASLCRGEFFMWAAHDDEWHPDFVKTCVGQLTLDPEAVLCYSRYQPVDNQGQAHGQVGGWGCEADTPRRRWQHALRHWELHAAIYGVMRRSALERARAVRACQSSDLIFMTEMALQGKIVVVDQVLHRKRIDPARPYRQRAELLAMMGSSQRRPWAFPRYNVLREQLAGLQHSRIPDKSALMIVDAMHYYVSSYSWLRDAMEGAQDVVGPATVDRAKKAVRRVLTLSERG